MAFRTNKVPVLQSKTASGAVATFNTALAMPLSSCNIAVNAWQEGSGDASPDNVRPIHGFSEVNATRAGKNLLNKDDFIIVSGDPYSNMPFSKATYFKKGTYIISLSNISNVTTWRYAFKLFDTSGNVITNAITNGKVTFSLTIADTYDSGAVCVNTTNISDTSCVITVNENCYITCSLCFGDVSSTTTCNPQIEHNNTVTSYEPYVTPTIYTIQLGEEVYGAEVDIVNGVAHVTHTKVTVGESNWVGKNGNFFQTQIYNDFAYTGDLRTGISDKFQTREGTASRGECWLSNNGRINVYPLEDYADVASLYSAIGDVDFVMPLGTPFDIQLTPTQINNTIIGNNTIFADTGDIDLTYKDLDIAKRGNFREVFKLPS